MSAASSLFYSGRSPVVLASASPRRVALLRQVGLVFTVSDPGPDRPWPGEADPRHGVRALALDKARRVAEKRRGAVVIGADTVVVARGVRLGKPRGPDQARDMLRRLHGRTHEVWTGVAVVRDGEQRTAAECTRVQMARLEEEEILAYLERHYDESEQADAHRAKAAKARRRYLEEECGCSPLLTH